MPKKSKNEQSNGAAEEKPRGRARSTTARSTSSKKKSSKPRKAKTAAAAPAPEPTDEEIRIRAYFIAERRHRFDLPGDADSDWLEAKRQLLSEAAPR